MSKVFDFQQNKSPLIYSILWSFLNKNEQNEMESDLRNNNEFKNRGLIKNENSQKNTKLKPSSKNISIYKFQEDLFD